MKQTAVEWLYDQLEFDDSISMDDIEKIFKQAKAMEEAQNFELGKRCFYKGFEKAENDDANCFTAWREEAPELLTFKSE